MAMKAPTVGRKTNVLEWWKVNEEQYLTVAKMARDYLGIPATSVPVERAFSGRGGVISKNRWSLHEDTIRACMCLKTWWNGVLLSGCHTRNK